MVLSWRAKKPACQEEGLGIGVEEHEPGQVERQIVPDKDPVVEGQAQVIDGQDVQPRVPHVRRRAGHPFRMLSTAGRTRVTGGLAGRDREAGIDAAWARSNRRCRSAHPTAKPGPRPPEPSPRPPTGSRARAGVVVETHSGLDWDTIALDMVGALRAQAGRDPSDRGLSDLIGELVTRSDGFAGRWARHDVRLHRTARKRLGNRVVGEIELTGDALDLAGDGLAMIAYSAAPGSQAEDQLKLLAAWSATARPTASEDAGTNASSAVGPGSVPAGNRRQGVPTSGPADR